MTVSQRSWTTRDILSWTTNRFKQLDLDSPLLDAQLLLSHVLKTTKIQLYLDMDKPLTEQERAELRQLVSRRLEGEPVAYILNEKHWYNLTLKVDKRVLIPRPETELLADFALETLKHHKEKFTQY
jgi:release factor glutamine methyltransferase